MISTKGVWTKRIVEKVESITVEISKKSTSPVVEILIRTKVYESGGTGLSVV